VKCKPVFDIVWRSYFTAQDVQVEFLVVVTASQSNKKALQPLLTVKNKALLFVILGDIEVTQPSQQASMEVVDELSPTNRASSLPNEKRTDGILTQNGVKKSTNLLFAPNEGTLNVWKPKAAVLLRVV
jgi:hypothetical protein